MKRVLHLIPSLAIAIVFSACASTPSLQSIPQSEIDRPMTLPSGTTRFHASLPQARPTAFTDSPEIPLTMWWEHALNDRLALIWYLVPLGLRYSLHESDAFRSSALFFLEFGDPDWPTLAPLARWNTRTRLSGPFALETDVRLNADVHFKESRTVFSGTLGTNLLWQPTSRLSIRPGLRANKPASSAWTFPIAMTVAASPALPFTLFLMASTNPDDHIRVSLQYTW